MALSSPQLPQKNGQLSTVNGVAEQGDAHVQEGTQDGQEEEVAVEDGKLSLQARLALAGRGALGGQTALAADCERDRHILSTENAAVMCKYSTFSVAPVLGVSITHSFFNTLPLILV